jgi:hypothetical protein
VMHGCQDILESGGDRGGMLQCEKFQIAA